MQNKLIKCIRTINEFSRDVFEKLNLGVEIQDFTEPDLLDGNWYKIFKEYKKCLEGFDGIISVHGAFLDLNPASCDKRIVDVTRNRYLTSLDIAKNIGANYVIFHSQINPWLKDPISRKLRNKRNRAFFREILEEIDIGSMVILIENIFDNDPRQLDEFVNSIDLPQIKICLDIGHAILADNTKLSEWIEVLKDRIEYIHFHWNGRIHDDHNPPADEDFILLNNLLNKFNISPIIALEYEVSDLHSEKARAQKLIKKQPFNHIPNIR